MGHGQRHRQRRTVRDEGRKHGLLGTVLLLAGLALILEHALGVDINAIFVVLGVAFAVFAKKGATWAWIPAGLFLLEPIAQLVSGLVGARGVPSVSLPLIVMAGGGVLVSRDRMPPGMARASLVGLLILAVLNLGGAGRDRSDGDVNVNVNLKRNDRSISRTALPASSTPSVTISNDDGDVEILTAPITSVRNDDVTVGEDQVVVRNQDRDLRVVVLPGTNVTIKTDDGNVSATLDGGTVVIQSDDGDVDLVLTGDPGLTLSTRHGDIDVVGYDDSESDESFVHAGDGKSSVVVKTDEGEIDVTRRAAEQSPSDSAPRSSSPPDSRLR